MPYMQKSINGLAVSLEAESSYIDHIEDLLSVASMDNTAMPWLEILVKKPAPTSLKSSEE